MLQLVLCGVEVAVICVAVCLQAIRAASPHVLVVGISCYYVMNLYL